MPRYLHIPHTPACYDLEYGRRSIDKTNLVMINKT